LVVSGQRRFSAGRRADARRTLVARATGRPESSELLQRRADLVGAGAAAAMGDAQVVGAGLHRAGQLEIVPAALVVAGGERRALRTFCVPSVGGGIVQRSIFARARILYLELRRILAI